MLIAFQIKLNPTLYRTKDTIALKQLFSFRERLIKNRNALLVAARENRTIRDKNTMVNAITIILATNNFTKFSNSR